MSSDNRNQWSETKEPNRGEESPDRSAQRGGHPGGYGPAQGEPVERSNDREQPADSRPEREH